ncbi:soul heme-binding protein [Nannochloropsis oceanica]
MSVHCSSRRKRPTTTHRSSGSSTSLPLLLTTTLGLAALSSGFVLPTTHLTPSHSSSTPTITTVSASSAARIALLQRASSTIDKTSSSSSTNTSDEPAQDSTDSLASQFEAFYNRALDGKPAQLKSLFAPGATWTGVPLAEGGGSLQDSLDMIDQGRAFMIEPRMDVTGARRDGEGRVAVDWQLSGTWPFPYRPRVRAAGTSIVTLDKSTGKIKQVEEKWDKPWWRVALEQASPRAWDLWHLYLTPPAEKSLYRVVKKLAAVEIREYYPRLVLELEQHDARPDIRFTELAWVLPDFAFTDELKLQGKAQYRETYVTTSPVESCVESVDWSPPSPQLRGLQTASSVPAKRIRHHVPVPSHLGLDPVSNRLPSPPVKGVETEQGQAGRYVLQPTRYMAVRRFKGWTQTDQYSTARRWLLKWCAKEGLKTTRNEMGKSRVWVQQHNMKAGFNMAGAFCLGIYEQPSYSDWGEIAVEVVEEEGWARGKREGI